MPMLRTQRTTNGRKLAGWLDRDRRGTFTVRVAELVTTPATLLTTTWYVPAWSG